MPKANDGRIPASLLKTADIGPVDPHKISKLSLRNPSRQPQLLYVTSNHAPHVFRHEAKATICCNLMRRIIMHINRSIELGVTTSMTDIAAALLLGIAFRQVLRFQWALA